MKKTTAILMIPVMIALSACGTTKKDREVSGALIGGTTGAVVGAAVAGSPWAGAAVGGAVGAVAGAAVGGSTSANDVNLGKPVWR